MLLCLQSVKETVVGSPETASEKAQRVAQDAASRAQDAASEAQDGYNKAAGKKSTWQVRSLYLPIFLFWEEWSPSCSIITLCKAALCVHEWPFSAGGEGHCRGQP